MTLISTCPEEAAFGQILRLSIDGTHLEKRHEHLMMILQGELNKLHLRASTLHGVRQAFYGVRQRLSCS
jgi:hypothetical protein